MSELLRRIESYCQGTAESENSFLNRIYVDSGLYEDIFAAQNRSLTILIGRKGTGKSALLSFIATNAKNAGLKNLTLKPDQLDLSSFESNSSIAALKRTAYNAILRAIAVKIGSEVRGLLNKREKKLFDSAIEEGIKTPDVVQSVLSALAGMGSALSNIDFQKLLPSSTPVTVSGLKDSLQTHLGNEAQLFVLLIDDVDQVASIANQGELNRIWSMLLAAKQLSEDLPKMKIVISLRTEVWRHLQRDSQGTRDQIDHFQRLLESIDPSGKAISGIIQRRIDVIASELNNMNPSDLFDGKDVVLPTTIDDRRTWIDYIATSSRGRPRDGVQLLGILAEMSRKSGYTKISQQSVTEANLKYSKERFDDLAREYQSEVNPIHDILKSFREVDFKSSSESLRTHLNGLSSKFGIVISGRTISPGGGLDSIIPIWRVLFESGFIAARVEDSSASRGFAHIRFEDDSDFVSHANWNEMQRCEWEIHPAYRSELLKLREDAKARGWQSKLFSKGQKR